ncbi:uncharacterized protein EV422DRAFT_345072 [Fimicolochytrium jonesii]|uniref:uncharacterized protein n=1 Tax=Fimicolochytrium jonesii TaxID=1396493 RepID=UPI0022FF2073|nr:uncharacterized protein EV422DRAFT_345072 [Fimicolochytrium jonesii]KAI8815787.1 hypothetical protein EV422DRAFT_345072 [Fimicolochytrium jonesii]
MLRPSPSPSTTPTTIVRRYLPQLARRVHPDLFAHSADPNIQQTNVASLQSLNALVSQVFPAGTKSSKCRGDPPLDGRVMISGFRGGDVKLQFYCKRTHGTPELVHHTLCSQPTTPGPSTAPTRPLIPPLLLKRLTPLSRARLETPLLAASFLSLCEKAGVKVAEADMAAVKSCVEKELKMMGGADVLRRASVRRGGEGVGTAASYLRKEFEEAIGRDMRRTMAGAVEGGERGLQRRKYAEGDAPAAASPPSASHPPAANSMENTHIPPNTFFHRALDASQVATATATFRTLPPAIFKGFPVLVAKRYHLSEKGVMVIPWDFTEEGVRAFLEPVDDRDGMRREGGGRKEAG